MTMIGANKIKCAICGEENVHEILISTNSFGSMDLDTRPPAMARQTLNYQIKDCPNCHYCNYDIDNNDLNINKLDLESEEYLSIINDINYDRYGKFLCSAHLYKIKDKYDNAGILYLNAAWLCDDNEDNINATLFRQHSIECFEKYLKEEEIDSDINIQTLMVDIIRRVGDFEKAISLSISILELNDIDDIIDNILNYQIKLCNDEDMACHNIGEILDNE